MKKTVFHRSFHSFLYSIILCADLPAWRSRSRPEPLITAITILFDKLSNGDDTFLKHNAYKEAFLANGEHKFKVFYDSHEPESEPWAETGAMSRNRSHESESEPWAGNGAMSRNRSHEPEPEPWARTGAMGRNRSHELKPEPWDGTGAMSWNRSHEPEPEPWAWTGAMSWNRIHELEPEP